MLLSGEGRGKHGEIFEVLEKEISDPEPAQGQDFWLGGKEVRPHSGVSHYR